MSKIIWIAGGFFLKRLVYLIVGKGVKAVSKGIISGLSRKRQQREREKEIRKRMAFRGNLRRIELSEKALAMAREEQRRKAIEAEKAGNHGAAVQFAVAAERMGQQAAATSDMKDKVLAAQAMQDNMVAFTGLIRSVNEMSENLQAPDVEDVTALQISSETVRDRMQTLLEAGESSIDLLAEDDWSEKEKGEKMLRTWMKADGQQKSRNILKETSKHLDAVMKSAMGE